MPPSRDSMLPPGARFATTRWSVVARAGARTSDRATESGGATAASDALASLCATYWPAVYAWLLRRGHQRDEARDLTQGFFAALVERDWVGRADEARGSFRAFLVTLLRRFVAGEREREQAVHRGGDARRIELDFDGGRGVEPTTDQHASPEAAFDAAWTRALLATVLERLRSEYERTNAGERFRAIEPHLVPGDEPPPFRDMAAALGLAESTCRVAVFRARRRFRELLRDEIAGTLADGVDVDTELESLIATRERGSEIPGSPETAGDASSTDG